MNLVLAICKEETSFINQTNAIFGDGQIDDSARKSKYGVCSTIYGAISMPFAGSIDRNLVLIGLVMYLNTVYNSYLYSYKGDRVMNDLCGQFYDEELPKFSSYYQGAWMNRLQSIVPTVICVMPASIAYCRGINSKSIVDNYSSKLLDTGQFMSKNPNIKTAASAALLTQDIVCNSLVGVLMKNSQTK